MALYVYSCPECGAQFEVRSPMPGVNTAICACGHEAKRIPAPVHHSFGWRLTEDSHIPNPNPYRGRKEDKFEKDI